MAYIMKQRAGFKELRLFYEDVHHQFRFIASVSEPVLSHRANHAVGYIYPWLMVFLTHIRRGDIGRLAICDHSPVYF